ncbi:MAG: DUF1273 domain-containing protein [Clostridiales bacterium]|nr:DUF1273 domain-containing protein [Clostridiales bacterium]
MIKQLTIKEKEIKTCAFTGHRELEEDFSLPLMKEKINEMVKKGVEIFYNGMAKGFDLISAEFVLSLKSKNPNIKLIACVPFYGQEKFFSEEDKKRYQTVLKKADEVVYLSEKYYKGCMHVRNRYMAERADVLIAYCKKQTGGTMYTVNYFQKNYPEKEVIFL